MAPRRPFTEPELQVFAARLATIAADLAEIAEELAGSHSEQAVGRIRHRARVHHNAAAASMAESGR